MIEGPRIAPLLAVAPVLEIGRAEHRCGTCGYVVAGDPPPVCPMCQTNPWEPIVEEPLDHPDRVEPDAVVDELAARRLLRQRRR